MAETIRSCIFCGAGSLTREDAWPLWLMKSLYTNLSGIMEAQQGEKELKPWRTKDPKLQIKCVCKSCNNGWMSSLEGQAKPTIESLVTTDSILIDSQAQKILSAWSIKNAMVFEEMRPPEQGRFYQSTERETFKNGLELPLHTSVWITKRVNNNDPYCEAYSISGGAIEITGPVSGYVTTMAFGALAIQVLSIKISTSITQYSKVFSEVRPGPWDQATLCIWPIQNKQTLWPPSILLSGEVGLQTFNDRWKPMKLD